MPLVRIDLRAGRPPDFRRAVADVVYRAMHEGANVIQITLNAGRSVAVKRALYRRIADLLHDELGVRVQDVFVSLVEVPKENWSFGTPS